MAIPLIDLTKQYESISGEIEAVVSSVMRSQRFILGTEVEALEGEIARYVGVEHAIGVASGTDALLLPLRALRVPPGSDVIVPAFTFFATAGAVWNAGLRPVFCDVDPLTFNVTAEAVAAAWTEKTVAVVAVHLFGQMADMEGLRALGRERGAFVLEDAAQAIGASSPAGPAGVAGDACAFSFFPTKNLGAFGDAGMVVTNDGETAATVRKLRVHGGVKMYHHEIVGTNSRIDALQASILRVKLRHLDRWTESRRQNARLYGELLAGVTGVQLPFIAPGHHHVFNQYTIQCEPRDALREHLTRNGIGSAVYYPVPLHLQQCFRDLGGRPGDHPVSERLCERVLSLPVFPELGEEQVAEVADSIRKFFDD
jgi:dTDP-4-amino-4,6-dideoxygalactose transaminase